MSIRVLIVDDSKFICKRIQEILEEESDFDVVGVANDGKQALVLAAQLEPDIITMDIEMPVMDGISAVKEIMADCPTAILMFSAATDSGTKATFEALHAGAIDFHLKNLHVADGNRELSKQQLRQKIRIVAMQAKTVRLKVPHNTLNTRKIDTIKMLEKVKRTASPSFLNSSSNKNIELLIIVASTGGPVAIQKILTHLSPQCSFPILIVQHMPHNFTKSFAERLDQMNEVSVKEAAQGDLLKPGLVLIGPGGMQMEVEGRVGRHSISIREKQEGEIYSPCADITLTSISKHYTSNVLVVVLTGMGSDGKEGVRKLKQKGAHIWVQDEASCTIYGMPKAIVDAKLADKIYSLDEIANEFMKLN